MGVAAGGGRWREGSAEGGMRRWWWWEREFGRRGRESQERKKVIWFHSERDRREIQEREMREEVKMTRRNYINAPATLGCMLKVWRKRLSMKHYSFIFLWIISYRPYNIHPHVEIWIKKIKNYLSSQTLYMRSLSSLFLNSDFTFPPELSVFVS